MLQNGVYHDIKPYGNGKYGKEGENMEGKRTLTVKELQTELGIARTTAYELVNSKGFPSFRIGKKILVNVERLNEWMQNGGERMNEDI